MSDEPTPRMKFHVTETFEVTLPPKDSDETKALIAAMEKDLGKDNINNYTKTLLVWLVSNYHQGKNIDLVEQTGVLIQRIETDAVPEGHA